MWVTYLLESSLNLGLRLVSHGIICITSSVILVFVSLDFCAPCRQRCEPTALKLASTSGVQRQKLRIHIVYFLFSQWSGRACSHDFTKEDNCLNRKVLKCRAFSDLLTRTHTSYTLRDTFFVTMVFARLSSLVLLALGVSQVSGAALRKRVTCASGQVTSNAACCGEYRPAGCCSFP